MIERKFSRALQKLRPTWAETTGDRMMFAALYVLILATLSLAINGCEGYSSESLYPKSVRTVYVKMFESKSFRRGVEYDLTDAIAKRIEAKTPYKIESEIEQADTVLSGQITSVSIRSLTSERETGRSLEKQVELAAVVDWKDLDTGRLLVDNEIVRSAASYSEWENQSFRYGSAIAVNKLAVKIVELMEKDW